MGGGLGGLRLFEECLGGCNGKMLNTREKKCTTFNAAVIGFTENPIRL